MAFDPQNLFAYKRLEGYPDHLAAVGLVTTEWVRLEKYMQMTLSYLLRDSQNAIVICNTLVNFRTKCEVLEALIKCMPEQELVPNFLSKLKEISGLSSERNDVIHGDWIVRASDSSLVLLTYKRGQHRGSKIEEHTDPNKLIDLANRITTAIMGLDDLNRELAVARGHAVTAASRP